MRSNDVFNVSYSRADAKRLLLFLLGCEILLVLCYILSTIVAPDFKWGPLKIFFDVDRESSIPTWFSSVQLFVIGLLLCAQARGAGRLGFLLALLGLGFMFLSADEAAAIHEHIIDSVKRLDVRWLLFLTFKGDPRAWMVPYAVVALLAAVALRCYLYLLWRDFRHETALIVLGLATFAAGGIGLELVSFAFMKTPDPAPYDWTVAGEEFLEMAGMSLVLYGVMLLGIKMKSTGT
jgi:hypothetical protein